MVIKVPLAVLSLSDCRSQMVMVFNDISRVRSECILNLSKMLVNFYHKLLEHFLNCIKACRPVSTVIALIPVFVSQCCALIHF